MGNNNSKKKEIYSSTIFKKSNSDMIIKKYVFNSRNYNTIKGSSYVLPNDNQETDRLNNQHFLLYKIFNKNFMVPIDDLLEKSVSQKEKFNEVNVLDIGCASGTWCLDMAKEFENVNFYGIDIGETFPKDIKFKNCNFKVGNIIKEFPFQENCFDFIHQRLLVAGIPSGNWVNVINNIKIGLKNDGWVELVEWDLDPFDVGPKFRELMDYGFDVLKDKNIDPSIAKKLKKLLESKNFKNINEICINVPINWDGKRKIIKKGKKIRNIYSEEKKIGELQEFLGELYVESEKIGYLHADDWKEIFKSLKKSIINKMNNPDNFDTLINDAIDECKNYNTYFKWYIIYGQINKIS